MNQNINQSAFLDLLKAGLWETEAQLSPFGEIDLNEVYRLAEEQSVVGLVTAGLEHVVDLKAPKEVLLQFVGQSIQLEQRNKAMNHFIVVLIEKLRMEGIYTLLVKGQGVAQCYQRPFRRACGDVDFLLSKNNYLKASDYLRPLASTIDEENEYNQHLSMTIGSWVVELHGTLRGGLWRRIDKALDEVQNDIFYNGNFRTWINGNSQVYLPRADEDVVFVFSHILQHFFVEGIGLRQICDWCRLLWEFKDSIDSRLLGKRLKMMGVMTEWKAFAALAVNYLDMPKEAIPFYSTDKRWNRKADKIMDFILETGNFGRNRDYSYYKKYPYLVFKAISFYNHIKDAYKHSLIFPKDALLVWFGRLYEGLKMIIKGK